MKYVLLILSTLLCFGIQSQNNHILNKIGELQIRHKDNFYHRGLFPSQRINKKENKIVDDNSIFFTGLISYTLKSVKDSLSKNDQTIIDSILSYSLESLKYYKNRNGENTYNFYQVRPEENPFPNGRYFTKAEFKRVPDDLDDTSIIYLMQDSSDSLNYAIKKKMEKHAVVEKYTSTYSQFRKNKIYKTWFSSEMKQDIDICVVSNVLTLMFQKELTLSTVDTASIEFIKASIRQDLHLNKEYLISPHYQETSIILYHVARLIAISNNVLLDDIKEKVIQDIYDQLGLVNNDVEKVILLTSLYRLGEKIDFDINLHDLKIDMTKYYWFKANPFCVRPFWVKKMIGSSNILNQYYRSKAYYWSLVLELEVLSKAGFIIDNEVGTITTIR